MPIYKRSLMDTLYYDEDEAPWTDRLCEVLISEGLITVSYIYDNEKIIYTGYEQSPGIYMLKGNDDCTPLYMASSKAKLCMVAGVMKRTVVCGKLDSVMQNNFCLTIQSNL